MIRAALALVFTASGLVLAHAAAPSIPANNAALEQRLATYDPKAVAAARHYYNQPAVKAGMTAMVDNLETAMAQQLKRQSPSMSPAQLARVQKIAGDPLKERLDLLLQMSMVNALEVMTPAEIEALDAFYSSPTGMAILGKMPQLSAALPAMIKTIMPDYLAEVRAKIKAAGAEDPKL